MHNITNEQYEEYQQYLKDKIYGRILTPDGLKFICEACKYDPMEIGKTMLNNLARLKNKEDKNEN